MINEQGTHRAKILNTIPRELPQELFKELLSWDLIIKSPYGSSYYNAPVGWDYKEPNSLRISDHWNFSSHGSLHCQTSSPVENNSHWTLAKFNGESGMYDIIKTIPLPKEILTKSQLYKLSRLDIAYDNAQIGFTKHTEGTSERLKKEWKSKMELGFLNKYFQLLETCKY